MWRTLSGRRALLLFMALLVALALVAAACGGDGEEETPTPTAEPTGAAEPTPTPEPSLDLEAAQAEGEVNWLTSYPEETAQKVADAFEAETDIKVNVTRQGGSETVARVTQEQDAGVSDADVVTASNQGAFEFWSSQGWLEPFVPPSAADFPADFLDPEGEYVVNSVLMIGIAYNPNLVSAEDAPTSWQDLTDPKWSGQLSIGDPTVSGASLAVYEVWSRVLGEEFMRAVAANDPLVVQSTADTMNLAVQGERSVAAMASLDFGLTQLKNQGEPIELVFPDEFVIGLGFPTAVFARAPHPNAAKVFLDFLAGLDGAQILADDVAYNGPQQGLVLPEGQRSLDEVTLELADVKRQEEESDVIQDLFREIFQ